MDLQAKYIELLSPYSTDTAYIDKCWQELIEKYQEPHRTYHGIQHIIELFATWESINYRVEDYNTVAFSIFYHDIIYDPTSTENEAKSANFFKAKIGKSVYPKAEKVVAQILATKKHRLSFDADTNFLLDLDLAVLGQRPEQYVKYCKAIRQEYSMYPEDVYIAGREQVLKAFIQRDRIYHTDAFFALLELGARENMYWEIEQLARA